VTQRRCNRVGVDGSDAATTPGIAIEEARLRHATLQVTYATPSLIGR